MSVEDEGEGALGHSRLGLGR